MRIHELAAGVTFALGLAACAGRAGNNDAGAANLTGANAVAVANETAAAEGGAGAPCPFPNRNWRATITSQAELNPRESTDRTPRIALTGEVGLDSSGQGPMMTPGDAPPPTIFLDLSPGDMVPLPSDSASDMLPSDSGVSEGTFYYNYQPGHVEAVIRCNGREIARVPIPAPARR